MDIVDPQCLSAGRRAARQRRTQLDLPQTPAPIKPVGSRCCFACLILVAAISPAHHRLHGRVLECSDRRLRFGTGRSGKVVESRQLGPTSPVAHRRVSAAKTQGQLRAMAVSLNPRKPSSDKGPRLCSDRMHAHSVKRQKLACGQARVR